MTWRVHVRILPRPRIPRAWPFEHALAALRFPDAGNVHVGKAIAMDVAAATAAEAEAGSARCASNCWPTR